MERPAPAVVDYGLLAAVVALLATGLGSWLTGPTVGGWLVAGHGVAGLSLVALLALKLRRVAARVRPGRLTRTRLVSVALAATALGALATGVAWVFGATLPVAWWRLLNVHVLLGLLVVPLLAVHLRARFRSPSTVRRSASRRTALRTGALLAGGAVVWRAQQAAATALGSVRRATGSREDGSGEGNGFPVTSWVADDPDPVDAAEYELTVEGLVESPLALGVDELGPEAVERATLDCTSGWYSVHDWGGLRVGDLLAAAGAADDARWVSFRSVTGYRWSLPLAEARDALLATHVDGERLTHGHGFPARLVAPGRRGFQWVKWVESVEVRRHRDASEAVAVFVSGFD
jgi:DMSO/TMAO reductase YedYZ molybdopterin-dependent catalytic subunit